MAYKKLEKGSEEWQFFKDYYEFRQKYYEADNSEEWFEKLIHAADQFYEKYKNVSFAEYVKQLILAHISDVDRRTRKNIGKNG